MSESCETCRYWSQLVLSGGVPLGGGECHRYPPTTRVGDEGDWLWPITEDDDWCGEFSEQKQ